MGLKFKHVLYCAVVLAFLVPIALFVMDNLYWTRDANADLKVFKPYVPNTEIDFTKTGDSDKYIDVDNGWGEQEPKWRCTIGDKAVVKLYVKDGQNSNLVLRLTGFGAYDREKDQNQKVTVYANDVEIDQWLVGTNNTYTAKIPADLMQHNTLVLRFDIDKPYVSEIDTRALGMAVREIVVSKNFAGKTKVKIGKWLKNKLKDIEVPDYTDSSENKK